MNAKNVTQHQHEAQKENLTRNQKGASIGKSLKFVEKSTTKAEDFSKNRGMHENATTNAFTLPHVGTYSSSTVKGLQSSPTQDRSTREKTNNASDDLSTSTSVAPWKQPRVIYQMQEKSLFRSLHDRLAEIPTRSKQSRQKLFLDIWSGQHWLELSTTDAQTAGILMPVSSETAVSLSIIGHYRTLNPSAFVG